MNIKKLYILFDVKECVRHFLFLHKTVFLAFFVFFSGITQSIDAQVVGSFETSDYIRFSSKQYTQVLALVPTDDDGFYACFESFELIDEKIVFETKLVAFYANGSVNTTVFDNGQLLIVNPDLADLRVKSVKIDSKGNILVLGSYVSNFILSIKRSFVAKYTSLGNLDLGFNSIGYKVLDTTIGDANFANDFRVDANDNVIVVGYIINPSEQYDPFATIFKLKSDGTFDESFNQNGYLIFPTYTKNYPSKNARVQHVAGGELKTIEIDNMGNYIVSGKIGDLSKSVNFVAKVLSNGTIAPTFFEQGYYFPESDNYFFDSFTSSKLLKNGAILFVISQLDAPYDVAYATLTNQFKVEKIEKTEEDFLVDAIETENGVFGLYKTLFSANFNILNSPNQGFIQQLTDENTMPFSYTPSQITATGLGKIEVQKVIYLPTEKSFVIAGKEFKGNFFQSFLFKIASTKVGLADQNESHFFAYPTISNSIIHLSSDNSIEKQKAKVFTGLGIEFLEVAVPCTLSVKDWNKGIYFIKSENGRSQKVIVK